MAKIIGKHKSLIFLVLIVFLGAFLRFWRLAEMASFDFDQEYASNFAYSVLREFPIQLIGQGLSVQGLFMGPLYFYYLVPFFAVFSLHPIGGAVGSVILGLGIIVAYYYFGTKIFGKPAGLIAAFLRAVLFEKISNDWTIVPAYSSELLVLVTWYCLYQYWEGNFRYLLLLGLVFGLYTSFHPILFPFYLVFLILLIVKRAWPKPKTLLLSVAAFIIPLTPLILFEYFHKFLEIKLLIGLFFGPKPGAVLSINKALEYTRIILNGPQYDLGIKINSPYLLSGIILLLMLIFTIRRVGVWKESFHLLAIGVTLLAFVLYYYFLPVHVPEYYFMAPVVLLFFYLTAIFGYLITKSGVRMGVAALLIWIFFVNVKLLQNKWANPSLITLAHKDRIVKAIIEKQPHNKDFFVSYINLPGWNFGFDYLFKLYDRKPKSSYVAGYSYTIVIPKSLSPESIDISSGNIGLILPF